MMRLVRPLTQTVVLICALALGARGAALATPSQHPAGQTLPTKTPGQTKPTNTPHPTRTPAQSGPTSTPHATPLGPKNAPDTHRPSRQPDGTQTPNPNTGLDRTNEPTTPSASISQPDAATAIAVTGSAATAAAAAGVERPDEQSQPSGLPPFPCITRPPDPDLGTPRVLRQVLDINTSITLLNCPWSASISAGNVVRTSTLEVKAINASASLAPNAGERFFGPQVELNLFAGNGQPIARPAFVNSIDLCFNYDADDVAITGNPAMFAIELYNPGTRQWERLPSKLDSPNSRVCASLPHLSLYALAARVPASSVLPYTGGLDESHLALWLGVWLALGLGLGASIWARRLNIQAPTPPKEQ